MKIHTCETDKKVKELKKDKKFIPVLIDKVITICKEDKHFNSKDDKIDELFKKLNIKNRKQTKLVEQSNQIEKDLKEKITKLENESFSLKVNILETLGSEI